MERFLGPYSPQLYAILRIVAGLMFAMHGTQKLFGWPGDGNTVEMASLMGFAGILELVTGLMIAFGFLTGTAAFIASGQMAVAFFMAHVPQGWNPLLNQGENAVLYCFLFLYMAARGAGIWSVDAAIGRGVRQEDRRAAIPDRW
ncbi:DoxX family protein [Pontibacter virosus]|uniref:Putative oxidoreductase n=1 Tax=Pontibacter virosus TaxID=1765052 RepID=A0A2U1ATA8_9BACT|nr:DoxX family protein [Pontibacter virosus]PVY39669.1 putative oxidoreductase [Pontibacter virosus]